MVTAVLRRPRRLTALITLLARTESERLFLSGSPAGQALRRYFDQRSLGVFPRNRLLQGVLLLPREHSEYLRGRRRQALRTNLARAATAGITCTTVTDRSQVLDEAAEVCRQKVLSGSGEGDWQAILTRPEITPMVAHDERGRPLAFAGVVIDEMVCLIRYSVAITHEARWALHDHLVRTLIAHRVKYLLADGGGLFGALGFTPNLQHYQHLLGYELRHVRPVAPPAVRLRPRLAPTIVALAIGATLVGAAAALATQVPQ